MTQRMLGRIAGFTYLGVVLTGIFCLAYAPRQLIEPGAPAETLANIENNRLLFFVMIGAGVVMAGCFAALPFTLARFLAPHGPLVARAMVGLALASLPFTLLAFWHYADLAAQVVQQAARPADVSSAREGFRGWLGISIFFWGAWLAPLGWLVIRSAAIPRILGGFLVVGSAGYMIDLFGPQLIERFADWPLAAYVRLPATIGELGTCLWLVLVGARQSEGQARTHGLAREAAGPAPR